MIMVNNKFQMIRSTLLGESKVSFYFNHDHFVSLVQNMQLILNHLRSVARTYLRKYLSNRKLKFGIVYGFGLDKIPPSSIFNAVFLIAALT